MTKPVDLRPTTSTRALGLLAGGLTVGLLAAGLTPASAQGDPVFGSGNHYFLAGAGNVSGRASQVFHYGDVEDDVYFGDVTDAKGAFGGDGVDDAMVRRGNQYIVRAANGTVTTTIVFGNPDDEIYVGDWDGDGTDTLMVRRDNLYFVANDLSTTPIATQFVYAYGDPDDEVYAGNWDGNTAASETAEPITTDTLMVRRGSHYFVLNASYRSGTADYDFYFGNPGDEILIGDWAVPPVVGDNPATPAKETTYVVTPGESGDYADQLVVRRGNVYFESEELWLVEDQEGAGVRTERSFAYGNPDDSPFAALLPWTYDLNGKPATLLGDGLAVRR